MQLPQRFDLEYVGKDGERHKPVIIHRVVFGSIERFFGILIEHFAGKFPLWLAPVQVKFIPIADRHIEYARKAASEMRAVGIRVDIDERAEKIGYKIREAQLSKVPYMMVIGDKEVEEGTLSVRSRDKGELGSRSVQEFIADAKEEIWTKHFNEQNI
jgi:threonyl-tRNA synthetase